LKFRLYIPLTLYDQRGSRNISEVSPSLHICLHINEISVLPERTLRSYEIEQQSINVPIAKAHAFLVDINIQGIRAITHYAAEPLSIVRCNELNVPEARGNWK
jgi:hypothetical protein